MIKQGLRHSHKYGWQSEEIAAFIDQYLRDVKPLAQITNEKVEEGLVSGEIISSTPVEVKACLALHCQTQDRNGRNIIGKQ
ncbi:MAG: hypothetical protein ACLVL2_08190 [Bacteroides cellulosilyticus]